MTVASGVVKAGPFEGNASTTVFPFTFKCFQSSDLLVVHYDGVSVETELTEGVDYSVSLNANQESSPGGSVTYPLSGSPLAAGKYLTLASNVAYTQTLDLILGGNWNPDNVEKALDRLVLMAAQVKEVTNRSLKVGIGTGISPDAFAADLEALSDAAVASAAAASTSEANAGTSETNAGTSETNALAYLVAFRDHWLGASATNPTLDGNGNALAEGDLYWNTAVPEFRVYTSGAWTTYLDPGLLTVSAFAETLLDDANAAAARATLGIGSAAVGSVARGSYTATSIASSAQDERSITHGLGTDDIEFGAVVHGGSIISAGGHDTTGMICRPDKAMMMFGRYNPASLPTITSLPASGDLRIAVKNGYITAQALTVHWWARTR